MPALFPQGRVRGFGSGALSILVPLAVVALFGLAAFSLGIGFAVAVIDERAVAPAFVLTGLVLLACVWRMSRLQEARPVLAVLKRLVTRDFFPISGGVSKRHLVAVYYARPRLGDPKPFDPYFVAICDCGWVGPSRDTGESALHDAYEHDSNVDEDVMRPLG